MEPAHHAIQAMSFTSVNVSLYLVWLTFTSTIRSAAQKNLLNYKQITEP